jgi:hypothetical protein
MNKGNQQFRVTTAFINESFKKNPTLQIAYKKQVPLIVCPSYG